MPTVPMVHCYYQIQGVPPDTSHPEAQCRSAKVMSIQHTFPIQYHGPYPKTTHVSTLFGLPLHPHITNVIVTKCSVSMKSFVALRLRSHFTLKCLQSVHATSKGLSVVRFLSTTLALQPWSGNDIWTTCK
jgi:hypothetical protein